MASQHITRGGCVGERVRMIRGAHTETNKFVKKGAYGVISGWLNGNTIAVCLDNGDKVVVKNTGSQIDTFFELVGQRSVSVWEARSPTKLLATPQRRNLPPNASDMNGEQCKPSDFSVSLHRQSSPGQLSLEPSSILGDNASPKPAGVRNRHTGSPHLVTPSCMDPSGEKCDGQQQSFAEAANNSHFVVRFIRPDNGQKECIGEVLSFLNRAQKTIDIAMYELSEKSVVRNDLMTVILSKARQDVIVRVITDIKYLERWNALKPDVRVCASVDASCEMHHKFVVVDGHFLLTGSFNWTGVAFYDNVVFCQHEKLARGFSHEFQRLWDCFGHGKSPAESTLQALDVCQLLCFPEDRRGNTGDNFNRLKTVVQSAEHSLDVCIFTITRYSNKDGECLTDIVCRMAQAGVSVRVLTDRYQVLSTPWSRQAVENLKVIGVPLRQQRNDKRMHHKFCVVDKRIVCTGSFNWTQKAHRANQENCVIFHDEPLATSFSEEFQMIWQQGIEA